MSEQGLNEEPVRILLEKTDEIDSLLHCAIKRAEQDQEEARWFSRWLTLSERPRRVLAIKALGRVHDRIAMVQHELASQKAVPQVGVEALQRILDQLKRALPAEDECRTPPEYLMWLLEGELRSSLAMIGSPAYLRLQARALVAEGRVGDPRRAAELERLVTNLDVDAHPHGQDGEGDRPQSDRALLLDIYDRELHEARHSRAREARRGQLLRWSAFLLLVSVAALATWLPVRDVLSATDTISALIAGALGVSLGGMRHIRDELERLTQMDAFSSALAAQFLAAGGLGILAAVLFNAGVLPEIVEGKANLVVVIYAFAAGFSEPFIIGAVKKVVGESASKPKSA
jgi:hypothetical protein